MNQKLNKNRRNFLKLLFVGIGSFLLGKVFGSFFSKSSCREFEKDFGEFRVEEDKKELVVYDRSGEKILIVDKQ
jgi:hypothetical protein